MRPDTSLLLVSGMLMLGAPACQKAGCKPEPIAETMPDLELPDSFASGYAPKRNESEAEPMPAEAGTLRLLQLNLCNSGRAGCYRQGRAVTEAIEVMEAQKPDVVTLNEICLADVTGQLWPALAAIFDSDATYYSFQPTLDHVDGAPSTCTSGSLYGIAVIGHSSTLARTDVRAFGDAYAAQDEIVEDRVWTCTHVSHEQLACTTHLSSDSSEVARSQCRELLNTIVPTIASGNLAVPAFVAGDFNLTRTSAVSCVPEGYSHRHDGSVQHVLASPFATPLESTTFELEFTDHPALFTTFQTAPAAE